jgi:Bacterial Ig-like domain (group 2)
MMINRLKKYAFLLSTTLLVACGGGGGGSGVGSSTSSIPTTITKIGIQPRETSSSGPQYIGTQTTLETITYKDDGKSTPIFSSSTVWTSSNPSVATVNSKGEVLALAPGKTTITVAFSNLKATYEFTTAPHTVKSLRIMGLPTSTDLPQGYKVYADAEATYSDGTRNTWIYPQWTSSAPSVATVTQDGFFQTVNHSNSTTPSSTVTVSMSLAGVTASSGPYTVIQKLATPVFTISCNAATPSAISAAKWNQQMASDPDNLTQWLVFEAASCSSISEGIGIINTKTTGTSNSGDWIAKSTLNYVLYGRTTAETKMLSNRTPQMNANELLYIAKIGSATNTFINIYAIRALP